MTEVKEFREWRVWREVEQKNTGLLEWMDKSNSIYDRQTSASQNKVYKTGVRLELMYRLEKLW